MAGNKDSDEKVDFMVAFDKAFDYIMNEIEEGRDFPSLEELKAHFKDDETEGH